MTAPLHRAIDKNRKRYRAWKRFAQAGEDGNEGRIRYELVPIRSAFPVSNDEWSLGRTAQADKWGAAERGVDV